MRYLASYYFKRQEKGAEASSSLLLQQASVEKMPVLLGCVCTTEGICGQYGEYITGQLLEWFYREGISLCRPNPEGWNPGEKRMRALKESLVRAVRKAEKELQVKASFSGMLCAGNCFVLLQRGEGSIYLLNTRLLRSHLKCLVRGTDGGLMIKSGFLQAGAGVLLADEAFCRGLTQEMLRECLSVQELHTCLQLQKHLEELGEAVGRSQEEKAGEEGNDGKRPGLGAVLFTVR